MHARTHARTPQVTLELTTHNDCGNAFYLKGLVAVFSYVDAVQAYAMNNSWLMGVSIAAVFVILITMTCCPGRIMHRSVSDTHYNRLFPLLTLSISPSLSI